jgi:endonuclease/exonuclease/phosphatase family metal-dependent hydrolase
LRSTNVLWNRPRSKRNPLRTLDACAEARLTSAYHHWFSEPQGGETRPTHYWRDRTADGPRYHIDYVFVLDEWTSRLSAVEVGGFSPWIQHKLSDHVPLRVDIDL